MNSGRVAFFDMDRTILSENSGNLYFKYLRRNGKIGRWMNLRGYLWYLQYRSNLVDVETMIKKTLTSVKGDRERDMIELCNRWFDEMVVNYIYPEAQPLMETHSRVTMPVLSQSQRRKK